MVAKIILNPYAGRWKAIKQKPQVENALRSAGVDFRLDITERPRHAIELAQRSVFEGYNPIVAVGGDGTSNEVINGILSAQPKDLKKSGISYGIIPLGSVNDLAVNLQLPTDLNHAAQIIASGKTRMLDLGMVIDNSDDQKKIHYFDNNSAVGLEPSITLIQERISLLKGDIRYITAALIGILQKPQWTMTLEWEDGIYDGPISLVTIGNTRLTGGVFYMTPHADPFDGKLTFVHGYLPTRTQILKIFPKTMTADKDSYVKHPAIHQIHTRWLRIKSHQHTPLHVDGEIQSKTAVNLEYRALPAHLPIILDGDNP